MTGVCTAMAVYYYCQHCRARLQFTRNDGDLGDRGYDGANVGPLQANLFDSSGIDESFIVLDDNKRPQGEAQSPTCIDFAL